MYKGCRYFLLLAAFIVGLGVLGGANEVEAAQVTEVRIITPADSGAVRGIDSLIVAEVDIFDVPTSPNLTVAMWLVTATDSTVVTENTSVLVNYKGGKKNDERQELPAVVTPDEVTSDEVSAITDLRDDIEYAASGPRLLGTGQFPDDNILIDASRDALGAGLVAVRKRKNNDDDEFDGKTFIGNADSVAEKGITNGIRFTWYLKVSPQLAEVTKVRVAAVAYRDPEGATQADRIGADDTATPTADESPKIVVSPTKRQFNVDGDRPPNPSPWTPR